MHIRAHVDRCDTQVIAGWIFDLDAPQARIGLEIYAAGQKVADVAADNFRPDLAEAGLGDGHIAFNFAVPPGSPTGEVQLKVSGSDLYLAVPRAGGERAAALRARMPWQRPG